MACPLGDTRMGICDRLRGLRESKDLSQGDIEKRTELLRCYISRVENGHTVPAIEMLEKFERALEERSTSSSMKGTSRFSSRISLGGRPQTTLFGEFRQRRDISS